MIAAIVRLKKRTRSAPQCHGYSHQDQSEHHHGDSYQPPMISGTAPKGVTGQEQHHDRNRIRDTQRPRSLGYKYERQHDWKRGKEDEQKNTEGTPPIAPG